LACSAIVFDASVCSLGPSSCSRPSPASARSRYLDLLIHRGIGDIGLGGEFGIGMALVAEAWPASKRARVSSYVGPGWQAGVLAAASSPRCCH
jgi:MFS family permease